LKALSLKENPESKHTDPQRLFTEAQRIMIYRRDKGLCQQCLAEELPEEDARVSWEDFEADHIVPYCKGGETTVENGQLLCKKHNRILGAKMKAT
jgi:5-methylcytosine-specific restriction endonuclease McrA